MQATRQMTLPLELERPAPLRPAPDERAERLAHWLQSRGDPEQVLTRAASLRQPWLRLITLGLKWWEFRSRPHGRPGWTIALHASGKFDADWKAILREAGASADTPGDVGAICAVATLGECVTITEGEVVPQEDVGVGPFPDHPGYPMRGVYFGWELEHVLAVDPPLPWKGALGVWRLPARAKAELLERVGV